MTAAIQPSRPTPSIRTIAACAALAVVIVWLSWQAWKVEMRLRGESETSDLAGKPAPGFNTITLDGRNVALADFRGKQEVVVAFWASWCVPCKYRNAAPEALLRNRTEEPH
jgi:thiol-disulfide isomerase/thioredoxin